MENFIIYIIAIFVAIGGIDRILGNKFKIGEEFSKAFYSMGALSLSMVGIISISPVLADILIPIISPVYSFLGLTLPCLHQHYLLWIWAVINLRLKWQMI